MDFFCTSCGSPMGRDDSTCSQCGRLVVRLPLDEARVSAEAEPSAGRLAIQLESLPDTPRQQTEAEPPRPAGTVVDRPARIAAPATPVDESRRRRRYGGTSTAVVGLAAIAVGVVGFGAAFALAHTGSAAIPTQRVVLSTPATPNADINVPALGGVVPTLAPSASTTTHVAPVSTPVVPVHSTPATPPPPPATKTNSSTTTAPVSKPPKRTTTVYFTQTFSG